MYDPGDRSRFNSEVAHAFWHGRGHKFASEARVFARERKGVANTEGDGLQEANRSFDREGGTFRFSERKSKPVGGKHLRIRLRAPPDLPERDLGKLQAQAAQGGK